MATFLMLSTLGPEGMATLRQNPERLKQVNAEVEAMLDVAVAGRIPQLWGRSEPNRGFGAALAIPELDDAVYDLFAAFRDGHDHERRLLSL